MWEEGEPYVTFCSWEAASYIRDYLKFRELRGEKITPEAYLFTATRKGGPLSKSRLENMWRKLCIEAGVDLRPVRIKGKSGDVRYNIRPHSLRKFFKTTLSISGVDRMVSEALLGHSLTRLGVESIYDFSVSRLDYLRAEYLKALNNLLFLKEPRGMEIINGVARKRIEELEQKLQALEEAISFYEKLIEHINKKNPKLLRELGLE